LQVTVKHQDQEMDFIHFPDPALLTLEPEKQFALFLGLFYGNTSAAKLKDILHNPS
jgi:hypothetical protein